MTTREDKTKRLLKYGTLVQPALIEEIEDLKNRIFGQHQDEMLRRLCRLYIEDLLDSCVQRGDINEYKLTDELSTTGSYKLTISTTEDIEFEKVMISFDLTIGDDIL